MTTYQLPFFSAKSKLARAQSDGSGGFSQGDGVCDMFLKLQVGGPNEGFKGLMKWSHNNNLTPPPLNA